MRGHWTVRLSALRLPSGEDIFFVRVVIRKARMQIASRDRSCISSSPDLIRQSMRRADLSKTHRTLMGIGSAWTTGSSPVVTI
jgi:hypothetical protein